MVKDKRLFHMITRPKGYDSIDIGGIRFFDTGWKVLRKNQLENYFRIYIFDGCPNPMLKTHQNQLNHSPLNLPQRSHLDWTSIVP